MAQITLSVKLEYKNAINQLNQIKTAIQNLSKILDSATKATQKANQAAKKATDAAKKAANASKKATEAKKKATDATKQATAAAKKAADAAEKETEAKKKAIDAAKKATEAAKKAAEAKKKSKQETQKSTQANEKHTQSILSMAKGFLQWQLAATLIMQPIQKLREAISSINETLVETESKVNTIRRILGDTSIDNKQIADELYEIAQAYGQSFENVSEAATTFTRAGYDYQAVIDATKASMLALNVAEIDATKAADMMIAIMAQYGLEASDLESIIDKMTKAADNYPVTVDKILVAMQRMGSTAANANVTLEESIGMITALSEATGRSGENIGTALNALMNYSSKGTALDTFASLSDEMDSIVAEYKKGTVSIYKVWNQLSNEINSITDNQLTKLDEYFNTEEGQQLADELSAELGDLNDQLVGVYDTAGTFRKNYFISLLKNWDTAKEAATTALNAEGYAMEQNAQILGTYEKKVESLKAQWQALANDEQGWLEFKKDLVEAASDILTFIKNIGGLKTVVTGLASVLTIAFGGKVIKGVVKFAKTIKTTITAMSTAKVTALSMANAFSMIAGTAGLVITGITAIKSAFENAKKASKEFSEALDSVDKNTASKSVELNTLDSLIDRYDELNNKTSLSGNEQQQLTTIVAQLKATYTDLDWTLDETTGKYDVQKDALDEYRKSLAETIELEAKKSKAEEAFAIIEDIKQDTGVENIAELEAKLDTYAPPLEFLKYGDELETWRDALSYIQSYYESIGITVDDLFGELNKYRFEESAEALLSGADNLYPKLKRIADEVKETTLSAEEWAEAIKNAKSEIDEANALQNKQNAILEAQAKLQEAQEKVAEARLKIEEAIAEARQKYLTDIVDDYVDGLDEATSLEEKQNAIIEARKELEKSIIELKKNALKEALKTEKEGQKQTLDLEKKRLSIEEARKKLLEASTALTVKVYDADSGGFTWQANQSDIDTAQADYDKAIEDYNTSIEESAWEEVEAAIEAGNTDTKSIKKIVDKYSAMWQGKSSPAFATTINNTVSSLQNYIPSSEEISSANEKVKSAVDSLNSYLKTQAVKELKEKINDGNISIADADAILTKWLGKSVSDNSGLVTWRTGLLNNLSGAIDNGTYDTNDSGVISAINSLNSALSSVTSAEKGVADAQNSLSNYLGEKLWDDISKSPNIGHSELYNLFSKYSSMGVSRDYLRAVAHASSIVSKNPLTAYELNKILSSTTYDSGGLLKGIGGIKLTARDEGVVLDPDLTSKIVSPSSNAQFSSFVRDLGILFGTSERVATGKVATTTTNNTTTNNQNYTVNGIPIPQTVAQKYTLADIFEQIAFSN